MWSLLARAFEAPALVQPIDDELCMDEKRLA